ncbi:ATP-binding protein [Paludisphaera soli]|uniref:ATP-binding protein n=1 Tax=Paludisphaera soli TaxID=2712865 RepID=UPI0013E9A905|nr:ATP-binding protein [Paludisphaera soli]
MDTTQSDPPPSSHGACTAPPPDRFERDREHLASLDTKLQLVRDYVGQVAGGYTTGLYLFGEGGIGKSHSVIRELDRLWPTTSCSTAG